jgi:serine/threonine protein kinase
LESRNISVNVKQFVQQLNSIGLLVAEELQPFVDRLGSERDAKAAERLAKDLIRAKKLTAFQAQAALQGKAKNLLLGNYLILEKLGQGGMGMVLKARHKRMDRVVALKILSAKALQSPDAIKRFQREVQAAARLHHPNIVTAFDADEALGTHFLVMEYVEGKNLAHLVREKGPLSVQQAVECLLQAARGLEYAHGKGIVHRDIKPANLLLGAEGEVKILDMGLARLEGVATGDSELTGTGQIMGTVDFMAPEQAVNTKDADQRADIYSLGITLWFLLTGRMAYGGDTLMAKLIAHREQPIPSLLPILAGGPSRPVGAAAGRVNDVFQKMVAKRPQDRYPSMTHLIADLVRCHDEKAGPPTISHGASEEGKFSAFLKGSGGGVQTAAKPAALTGLEETIVTGSPQGDTDPDTGANLGISALTFQQFRQPSKAWLRDWRVRVAAIGSVVGLSLLMAVVLIARPFGKPEQIVAQNPPPGDKQPDASPIRPVEDPRLVGSPLGGETRGENGWTFSSWKPLFDGYSKADWTGEKELLTVENGVLVTASRSGTVVAPGEYRDFEVEVEFRLANGGNNGLGLFYPGYGIPAYAGLEVQLLDDLAYQQFDDDQMCGGIYSLAAPKTGHFLRWPEWNRLRVTALGDELRVRLNEVDVVSTTRPALQRTNPQHVGASRTSGSICLTPHTGRCEFRSFRIREATRTAATGPASHTIVPSQPGMNRPAQEQAAAYNGHSYKAYPDRVTWKEAQSRCRQMGGHLVVIETAAENQFVAGLLGKAGQLDAWIGITDELSENDWRTVTEQRQLYTNWATGQPNNKNAEEHYALISNRTIGGTAFGWKWADQPNDSQQHTPGYVCEWDELPMSGP